ncbi:MAG: hypothetical protein ACLS5K_04300 [Streptococcus salivarius]
MSFLKIINSISLGRTLKQIKEDKIQGNEIDAASYDRLYNTFSGLLGIIAT